MSMPRMGLMGAWVLIGCVSGCQDLSVDSFWPWSSDEASVPSPASQPVEPAASAPVSEPNEDELARQARQQADQLQAAMALRRAAAAHRAAAASQPSMSPASLPTTLPATSAPAAERSASALANEPLGSLPTVAAVKPAGLEELLRQPLTDDQALLAQQALTDWQDRQPVKIRQSLLCRKVRGYGVYETVEAQKLVAGKPHRVIVYAELEHFRSTVNGQGDHATHQVKLQQEISIYQQSDGFEVLKLAPVTIVDESHRRRRDFFVVQMLDIPGRLTVGQYTLKLRVTDQQSQTQDEVLVPLTLVAQ